MKTIIQGKILKTTYGVDDKRKTIQVNNERSVKVYTGKPELTKNTEIVSWETIAEFDEKIEYNSKVCFFFTTMIKTNLGEINLTEDEKVNVIESITRVDLGAYVLHVDKILDEKTECKSEAEEILKYQIKDYNKQMIESNERLLGYCKLHNLVPSETDVDELFKQVYPNESYRIEDGKLIVNENKATITFKNNSYCKFNSKSDLESIINEGMTKLIYDSDRLVGSLTGIKIRSVN